LAVNKGKTEKSVERTQCAEYHIYKYPHINCMSDIYSFNYG